MPPGRPNDAQHRRFSTILGLLAGQPNLGATRATLMGAIGKDPSNASHVRAFFRDLATLENAGWHINHVKLGDEDRYQLTVVDPRLHASFTAAQRAELLRAAQAAGIGQVFHDLDRTLGDGPGAPDDPTLAWAQRAIELRCVLTFTYKGKPRRLHPYDLDRKPGGWRLRGLEVPAGIVKVFRLELIEDIDVDGPGTAEPAPADLGSMNVDPMRRREHEPIEVELRHLPEHQRDVERELGAVGHWSAPGFGDGHVRTVVTVTYLDAFIDRLLEMERRVELIAPESVRDALRDRLRATMDLGSEVAS